MIFLLPKKGYVTFLESMIKICENLSDLMALKISEWNLKNQKCCFYGCMGNDGAFPYLFPQHRGVPYLKLPANLTAGIDPKDWSYLDRSSTKLIHLLPAQHEKNVSSKNICWNLGSSSRSWGISTSGSSWTSRCQKAIAALMPKQQSSLFFCLTCSGWWI